MSGLEGDALMGLPPVLRARVVRHVAAEAARHTTTITNLRAQMRRLLANKDLNEKRMATLALEVETLKIDNATLCGYIDLMDSPKWKEIEYADYKERRGRYVSLRQEKDPKFRTPILAPDWSIPERQGSRTG